MKQQLCFFFCSSKLARLYFRKKLVALFSSSFSAMRTNSSYWEGASPYSLPIIVSKTKFIFSPLFAEVSMHTTCSSLRKDCTSAAYSQAASSLASDLLARRRTTASSGACSRKRASHPRRLWKDSLRGTSKTRSPQWASRR